MEGVREFLVFLLGAFLVVTGAVAIISSLHKIYHFKEHAPNNSSLETKYFKWNAPAALSYGFLAIGSAVALVYIDQMMVIKFSTVANKKSSPGAQNIYKVPSNGACSIVSGTVIVKAQLGLSSNTISFQGVSGISKNPHGPFVGSSSSFWSGDQIFIRTHSGEIWAVNVLKETPEVEIETTKMNF